MLLKGDWAEAGPMSVMVPKPLFHRASNCLISARRAGSPEKSCGANR